MKVNQSAHPRVVRTLIHEHLNWIVVVHRRSLNLQDQYLADVVLSWHCTFKAHVLFQLQIHEKLGVGLAVHEVLGYYVVGLVCETLVGDRLNFEGEVESTEVLEGNRRHPYLVLFCWNFDHWRILIRLIEILDADDLRNFALGKDGQADWLQTLQLYLQEPLDCAVFPHWWDLDCHLHLRPLPFSDFEPNLFEILESLIAADGEDVFVEIVELGVVAFGNDPEHEGV